VHEGQVMKWKMRDEREGSDETAGKGEISTLLASVTPVPGVLANGALGADVAHLVALVTALVSGEGNV
jgi:hypothetical protein